MIALSAHPDGYSLSVTASSMDTPRLKQVPGARYRVNEGWTLPATPATVLVLSELFRPDEISVTDSGRKILDSVRDYYDRLQAIRSGTYDDYAYEFSSLWPFQKVGANFLSHAQRVLLADEMGTGKTVQVLSVLQYLPGPHLVVCPNSVKYNWEIEAEVHAPNLYPVVVDGTATQRRKQIVDAHGYEGPVLVIINYESMTLHTRWKSPTNVSVPQNRRDPLELNEFDWSSVTLDEAHRIKNVKANQTMAAHGVADGVPYRFALTGTPILNNEAELWPLLKWVDPDQYPDKKRFHTRYLVERPGFFGGMEVEGLNPMHSDELHQILGSTMLRRTKAEVLPDLPPKLETTRLTPMQPKQAKAYDEFKRTLVYRLENGMIAGRSVGEELARLRQLACGMPVVDSNTAEVIGLEAPSSKMSEILWLLEETGDDPMVVYVEHRKFLDFIVTELRHHGHAVGYVAGGMPAAERQRVVEAFQNGEVRVFVATTAAAAEGITLTAAARLVFAQLPWSQGHYLQAQDRIHRPGAEQHEHVEIVRLLTPGTIEQVVLRALHDKALRLDNVTQDSRRLLELLKECD